MKSERRPVSGRRQGGAEACFDVRHGFQPAPSAAYGCASSPRPGCRPDRPSSLLDRTFTTFVAPSADALHRCRYVTAGCFALKRNEGVIRVQGGRLRAARQSGRLSARSRTTARLRLAACQLEVPLADGLAARLSVTRK
ncbi:MAG: hypothetical protein OJF58_003301 [Enhydrobacter sp.]|nr:MAG: hypothetical protein OJF58_003301 [Enhydrobacter sp.]